MIQARLCDDDVTLNHCKSPSFGDQRFNLTSTMDPSSEQVQIDNNYHVQATPVFELSSVSIPLGVGRVKKFDNGSGCLCAGINVYISLVGDDNREIKLFEGDSSDTEALFLRDDSLMIMLGKSKDNVPQWLPKSFLLKLFIEGRNESLYDGFELNFCGKVVYDREQCLAFHSRDYGLVTLRYTIYKFGVLACVECTVLEKNSEEGDSVGSVSGTISATFKVRDTCVRRVLFEKLDSDPLISNPTQLLTDAWLAVPAYSFLGIQIDDLVVNHESFETSKGALNFEPILDVDAPDRVEIMGGNWRLMVSVQWRHPYFFCPTLCECFYPAVEGAMREESEVVYSECEDNSCEACRSEDISVRRQEKKPRFQSIQQKLSELKIERIDPLPSLLAFHTLVEIFSISVRPYADDKDVFLSGTIDCYDFFGKYVIFNRDKNSPVMLHSSETVAVQEPRRSYTGAYFGLRLDLKDSQGLELSRGYLAWNDQVATFWLDRRTCSVVRGQDGFATVHYTIFSRAVQARVKVSLASKGCQACRVRGTIRARYTGYRYFTLYDKKYYQSVLFKTSKREFVKLDLDHGGDLPLIKPVVAVPADESLVVLFNLHVAFDGGEEKMVRGKATFEAHYATKPMVISGPQSIGALEVSVGWG